MPPEASRSPGFGVYVHWPFCQAKCPYCDFNSHVRHGGVDAEAFAAGLVRELETMAERTRGRRVASVFFGGGTPSLMPAAAVGAVLDAVARLWAVEDDVEVTLEANPTSVEAARFAGYRTAGVGRVSLGVQALDDAALAFLGRLHSLDQALAALDMARATFPRVSFDLIYARPGQTPEAWAAELARALDLAGEHLSLYQLTIEPDTPFSRLHEAGRLIVPDADASRALFDVTQTLTAEAGLPAYEISNHARPGAECRHNLVYWRSGEFVGVGPGAHGRLDADGARIATATERNPEVWLSRVRRDGHGLVVDEALDAVEVADEYLVMGLRLAEGIDRDRFARLAGRPLDPARIDALVADGMVELLPGGRVRVTPEGFPVLNAVVADLAS